MLDPDEFAEEVEWLLTSNAGWGTTLLSLGYRNSESLARRLRRIGRDDLARKVERLDHWKHQESA